MATVLPLRQPNTNSIGSTSTSTSARHSSFPSSTDRSTPHSPPTRSYHRATGSNASSSPSYRSSTSAVQMRSWPPARKTKPIRSRYPADSTEKHVEYILVASFDIDRGSVMEHQYPGPVGGDEVMLAELMLPDQTHLRSQDWTIFFLHKDSEAEEASAEKEQNGDGEDHDSEDEQDSMDGPPLVYVLNLVNTKTDNTVKRGAVVKAMAVCTRHSFLHIYKPLLLLALEQYFAQPQIETLANLYDAVNGMDLSMLPRLNYYEQFILQASGAKDLFIEKFEAIIAQRMAETESDNGSQGELSPALQPTRSRFGLPRDTHEFESVVNYSQVPVPIKIPVALSPETVGDFSLIKLIMTFSTPHSTSPTPFTPTHPHLTTSGPNTHPIIVLLNALLTQKRIIFLGHNLPSSEVAEAVLAACALASGGMLQGFTRHAFPYTDLTKIDDLLKVPGFIAGVTNPAFGYKSEWWDVLCDISTGKMRISDKVEPAPVTDGVTYFQQNPQAPATMSAGTGIVAIAAVGHSLSAGLGGNAVPTGVLSGDPTGDAAFMNSILSAINERHGENAIRTKFRLWITKFTRLASAFEELVYGASALHINSPSPKGPDSKFSPDVLGHGYVWVSPQHRHAELAANATRIEGWRSTRSYYNFVQDLAAYWVHRPVKALDLQHLHDRLAKLRLGPEVSANIYLAICSAVQRDQEINQLLATVANGSWDARQGSAGMGQGLFYLALGLFHPKADVRTAVAGLLSRIREHEAGRHFWGALGRFHKVGWERVARGMIGEADASAAAEG